MMLRLYDNIILRRAFGGYALLVKLRRFQALGT